MNGSDGNGSLRTSLKELSLEDNGTKDLSQPTKVR